jgi:hypothetical protein
MRTYLTRTAGDEVELVSYIEWYVTRRDITLSTLFAGTNPMAGGAYLDNWGYQRAPWPWQLADPNTIAVYLNETTGGAQGGDQAVSTGNSNTTDSVSTIALVPSTIEARPGQTIQLDITYTRLQGVTDAAFMASAENAAIMNLPLSDIDRTGALACTPEHEADAVQPSERTRALIDNTVLPSYLELSVSDNVRPGDQLSVCFELTGFSGTRELFSWNTTATIVVVDD